MTGGSTLNQLVTIHQVCFCR